MDEAYWAPPSIIEPDPQRSAAVQLQFSARWQRLITDPGVKKKVFLLCNSCVHEVVCHEWKDDFCWCLLGFNKDNTGSHFITAGFCPEVHALVLRLRKVSRSESFLSECSFLFCYYFLNLMQTDSQGSIEQHLITYGTLLVNVSLKSGTKALHSSWLVSGC